MSNSLAVLVQQASQLEQLIIENEGEITPEMEAFLVLKEINLPEKVDGCFQMIERFEHIEMLYKAQEQRLAKIRKQCATVQDRIKANIKQAMRDNGLDELMGNDMRFKLSATKPSVVIEDESLIPEEYKKQVITTSIEKDRLKEDLALGDIPGAKLELSFALRSYSNIKAKKVVK